MEKLRRTHDVRQVSSGKSEIGQLFTAGGLLQTALTPLSKLFCNCLAKLQKSFHLGWWKIFFYFQTPLKSFFPYTDNILVCFSSLYFYSSVSISADAAFSYMMACSDEHSHHGTFFSYGITAATFVNTCILKQSEWKTKMILFSCLNSPELAEVLSEDFQGFLQEVLNGVTFLHLKQKYTNGEKTKAWGEKPVCKVLLRTVQITFFFSLKTSVPVGSIFTLTVFRCPEPSQ